jgi:hypothetical protein
LLVKFLGPLMEHDTYLRSLLGGDARQKCYLEGLIHYRLLVFEFDIYGPTEITEKR